MTLASLVLLFAAYMVADRIFSIVAAMHAARRHVRWGALVPEGIAGLASAICPVLAARDHPGIRLFDGRIGDRQRLLLSSAAFRLNLAHGRWLMGLSGFLSVLWGFLLLFCAVVLTWWMGAYAIVFGGALIILAFRLRRLKQELPPSHAVPHPV